MAELIRLLKETPHESRNLGIKAFMIDDDFFAEPDFRTLCQEIAQLRNQQERFFLFARIPKSCLRHAPALHALGFYVVEATVTPYTHLGKNEMLHRFIANSRDFVPDMYRDAHLVHMSLSRSGSLPTDRLKQIAGESFSDDRFHLDRNCPTQVADRRFEYWIADLVADATTDFDVLQLEGSIIAFLARKRNYLLLAGFSKRYISSGLGEYLWLSTCNLLRSAGHTIVETCISINNLPVLNLYSRLGFKFKGAKYSLHCWYPSNLDTRTD